VRLTDKDIKLLRDLGTFLIGAAGAVHQFFFANPTNPVILATASAFLAGPAVLQLRDRIGESGSTPSEPPSSRRPGS
jgi:hypothetical protein